MSLLLQVQLLGWKRRWSTPRERKGGVAGVDRCLSGCIRTERLKVLEDVHAAQLCSEDVGAGVCVPGLT